MPLRHLLLAADISLVTDRAEPDEGSVSAASVSSGTSVVTASSLPQSAFQETADDKGCITEPEDFIKLWRSPNPVDRDVCVDSSIIVRLKPGDKRKVSLEATLADFFNKLGPVSFWAFKDAAEKYLRTGVPQSVGSYIDGILNTTTNSQDDGNDPWHSKLFPGIRKKSNGVAMLEQIGFGSDFYRVDLFYLMMVGKRDRQVMNAAGVPSFVPTFENVRIYYEDFVRQYIKKQGNLGKPEDFSIPTEVVSGVKGGFRGLANTDLSELTGCPSQCTFEDRNYPDLVGFINDKTSPVPAVTPGIYTNHTGNGRCNKPVIMANVTATSGTVKPTNVGPELFNAGRLRLGEPTQLSVNEYACTNRDWKRYYLLGDYVPSKDAPYPTWERAGPGQPAVFKQGGKVIFPGLFEICNKEQRFPGPLYMDAFVTEWQKIAPTNYRAMGALFRAFLTTGCAGNFNQLFSGNGLLYTGHGGVSTATSHELLLGGIYGDASKNLTAEQFINTNNVLGKYAYSFFCIDGTENCCPNNNCKSVAKPAWE